MKSVQDYEMESHGRETEIAALRRDLAAAREREGRLRGACEKALGWFVLVGKDRGNVAAALRIALADAPPAWGTSYAEMANESAAWPGMPPAGEQELATRTPGPAMADDLAAAREREGRLRGALNTAGANIKRWLQLAVRQRMLLDHNRTVCPTQASIDASAFVLDKIAAALADGQPAGEDRDG